MRKTVAAAAMAASLTVGGAAGVALFTPTLSGAQTDTTEVPADAERPRLTERLRGELQPLVDDGTIDASQADAVAAHLAEQAPLRHHRGGPGPGFGDAVLEALGLDAQELRDQLASGMSLADVAEANGIDVQAVVDAIVAAHEERLAAAVEAGRITQEQADERSATFQDHAEDLVERTFEPGEHRHGRTGGPGPFGDRSDGPTDDTPGS